MDNVERMLKAMRDSRGALGRRPDVSTLQATKMGEPVYARLGHQRIGAIRTWEKRKA